MNICCFCPSASQDYGKSRMKYADYTQTESGLQYKDLKEGSGDAAAQGDTLIIDWDGCEDWDGRMLQQLNWCTHVSVNVQRSLTECARSLQCADLKLPCALCFLFLTCRYYWLL